MEGEGRANWRMGVAERLTGFADRNELWRLLLPAVGEGPLPPVLEGFAAFFWRHLQPGIPCFAHAKSSCASSLFYALELPIQLLSGSRSGTFNAKNCSIRRPGFAGG